MVLLYGGRASEVDRLPWCLKGSLVERGLRGRSQQQIAAGQPEQDIRGPGSQGCGQIVDVAHGLKQGVDHKVGERHEDGHGDAGERAAAAHRQREGNGQHSHDDGDERVGELLPEQDSEAHGVKSALAQIADVAVELAKVHLLRLPFFLREITWVFMDFREGGLFEFAITGDVGVLNIPLPAVPEAPGAGSWVPEDAGGKDAAGEREGGWIELKDGEIGEFVADGIEELVVKDAGGLAGVRLAEDPFLLGVQEGLGRTALDDVAQRLLLAIGLEQIKLVEEEEAHGQDGGDGDDGNHQPVKADAGGLHGDEFAVAVEHAKGDQHGDQHRQWRYLVEHAGREVDQIVADRGQRNVVAQDVAHQIEEGENQHEQDEAHQHQEESVEELAHHVFVENAGKDAAGRGALGARLKPAQEAGEGNAVGFGRGGGPGGTRGPGGDRVQYTAAVGHLPKQEDAARAEEQVGHPDREERGNPVLTAQGGADQGNRVIDDNQRNGSHHGGALAASPRGHTQRNAHQHQHQAGHGVGEAVVQLDQESPGVGTMGALQQRAHGEGEDGRVQAPQVHVALLAQLEWTISGIKGGDVVLERLTGHGDWKSVV